MISVALLLCSCVLFSGIEKMTEKSPASAAHVDSPISPFAAASGTAASVQPGQEGPDMEDVVMAESSGVHKPESRADSLPDGQSGDQAERPPMTRAKSTVRTEVNMARLERLMAWKILMA